MKPKSILDPTFKYVPAAETDIRKTFARIRREFKPPALRVGAVIVGPNYVRPR